MPRPMLRRALSRRRRHRLLVAAALGALALRPIPSGERPPSLVTVATRDVAVGERITADDVRDAPRARRDTPDDAVADPVGRVVRERVLAGEPFPERRLGGTGGELSERLDDDERAVMIPSGDALPPVHAGDRVELVGRTPEGAVDLGDTARVMTSDERGLVLAVPADAAGAVGAALGDGTLVVLVAPPP